MVTLFEGWSLASRASALPLRSQDKPGGEVADNGSWARETMLDRRCRVHFVGIGGIGMSGIAEVLLNLGYKVSGSDLVGSELTERLARLGAEIGCGHSPDRINSEVDVVVISSAVKYANPEVARARELKIPVIPRAEMLAELMRMKFSLAVAGTHGKTSTTSMLGKVLGDAGLDPTIVVGGKLKALGSNARLGQGAFLVAEADESDGSFLLLTPTVAIVTNIDPEHLDHYGDMDRVTQAYLDFVNRVPFYGRAVLCIDSLYVRTLIPRIRKRFVTYGLSPEADIRGRIISVEASGTILEVMVRDKNLGKLSINIPGRHYAENALAVVAAASELAVPFATVARGLADFEGIHRRFELKGTANEVTVVDDYGHHPEEIKATLRAAREAYGRRIVAVFQPHRFSRTRDLFDEFLTAFDDADLVIMTDIYAAGEEPLENVTAEHLFREVKRCGRTEAFFVPDRKEVAGFVIPLLRPGDMVVTLGAGNIWQAGEEILKMLARRGLPQGK